MSKGFEFNQCISMILEIDIIVFSFSNQALAKAYKEPNLKEKDLDWCKWAVTKGGVVVGKSWGKLKPDKRKLFDHFNCNAAVTSGRNPSCDDEWGDQSIYNWQII